MFAVFLLIASFLGCSVLAQRPSNATLCDYYAIKLFGSNTTDTQYKLIQNILALAFAGGSGLANVSSDLTGIFNPGTIVDPSGVTIPVDLQQWFNASIPSTNFNNAPAAVNWLDAGGKGPLSMYLNGQTTSILFGNTTNEYGLFNRWIRSFSNTYGCTLPPNLPATTGPRLNLAYVHKYMDLNQTDLGHFINQITLSSEHWGFSTSDAAQMQLQLNAKYNVRCSPAVGTQLYSLCQDETCPLAPQPDCYVYVNLGPSGVQTSGVAPSQTSTSPNSIASISISSTTFQSSPSTSASSSSPSSTSSLSPTSTPTSSPSSSSSATPLSPGAIAGIALGGSALFLAFILLLIWLLRRRKTIHADTSSFQPSPLNPGYVQPAYTDPHSSYTGRSQGIVENWNGEDGMVMGREEEVDRLRRWRVRGIGLHFVKIFTERKWTVFGTIRPETRKDSSFNDLLATGATILDLDYLDETSIVEAAKAYEEGELDILVNCAGVDVHPRVWGENSADDMITKFRVMTVGPFLATKHFMPNLKKSTAGKVVNISSDYVSISLNDGRCISYRIAKAALNHETLTISHELKAAGINVTMLMLDPGDVPTRLSRGNGKIDIDQSVRGMVGIIEKATMKDTGCFYKWNGETLPF